MMQEVNSSFVVRRVGLEDFRTLERKWVYWASELEVGPVQAPGDESVMHEDLMVRLEARLGRTVPRGQWILGHLSLGEAELWYSPTCDEPWDDGVKPALQAWATSQQA